MENQTLDMHAVYIFGEKVSHGQIMMVHNVKDVLKVYPVLNAHTVKHPSVQILVREIANQAISYFPVQFFDDRMQEDFEAALNQVVDPMLSFESVSSATSEYLANFNLDSLSSWRQPDVAPAVREAFQRAFDLQMFISRLYDGFALRRMDYTDNDRLRALYEATQDQQSELAKRFSAVMTQPKNFEEFQAMIDSVLIQGEQHAAGRGLEAA